MHIFALILVLAGGLPDMAVRLDGARASSTTEPGTHLKAANVLDLGANGETQNKVSILMRFRTPYVFNPLEDDTLTLFSARDRSEPQDYLIRGRLDAFGAESPHPYMFQFTIGRDTGSPTHYEEEPNAQHFVINELVTVIFQVDFSGGTGHPATVTLHFKAGSGAYTKITLVGDSVNTVTPTMRQFCVGGHYGTAAMFPLQSDNQNIQMDCQDIGLFYRLWSDAVCQAICEGASPLEYLATGEVVYGIDDFWPLHSNYTNHLDGPSGDLTAPEGGASFISNFSGVTNMATAELTLVNDSHIKVATPTENYGLDPVGRVQSNATGTVTSRIFETWTGLTDRVPVGATIDSVAWAKNCASVNVASAQPLQVLLLTRTIVEGTGTALAPGVDGVTYNKYDGTNDFTTPGGDVDGTVSDDDLTDAALVSPLTTGVKTYNPLLCVRRAFALGQNTFCLMLRRKVELTTASNAAYDTKDNGTAPTLVVTYTPAAAGGGGVDTVGQRVGSSGRNRRFRRLASQV